MRTASPTTLMLNAVLWKAIKGDDSPVPQPRRSAFVIVTKNQDPD